MMKRFGVLLLIVSCLCLMAQADSEAFLVQVNQAYLDLPVDPIMHQGSIYVPVREISQALGGVVNWISQNAMVSIGVGQDELLLATRTPGAYYNGRLLSNSVEVLRAKDKIFVPIRFVSTFFGADVQWLHTSKTVIITTKASPIVIDPMIMGKAQATASQMATFLLAHNDDPEIPCTALELAQIYLEEGAIEGVRGDIAFAQSILETGYFEFRGSMVSPSQHNYAGLGVTGSGVKGLRFATVREGVRAQIQHLKAYGSTEALKQVCVDPRFSYVTRGSAAHVEDLAQALNDSQIGWAYPGYDRSKYSNVSEAYADGQTYGQRILFILEKILFGEE